MIEAQVQSTGTGAIIFDGALGIAPDDRWFDGAHWSKPGDVRVQSGGRGEVTFVETPVGACALRHYHRGGWMARINADRYVWTGARRTRAFREFKLLARLADVGLPVPAPVAARYSRDGINYRADLLTRRIPFVQTLAARLATRSLDSTLAECAGDTIARLHACNVWHADLNAHNILVDESVGGVAAHRVWLIDFDRGRLRKPDISWQQGNLKRLRRSLEKLGAHQMSDFDAQFWHPLLAAYHATMSRQFAAHAQGISA